MTYEEYKQEVREFMLRQLTEEETDELMEEREETIKYYFEEGVTPIGIGSAIVSGLE